MNLSEAVRKAVTRLRYGRPIVIVSGLPRSGTSMAMRMLEAGGMTVLTDGVRRPDEDNPHGYFELERVLTLDKGGDSGWLKDARGKAVKIVSGLLPYLPEHYHYRVMFMRRDLREVLASQHRMLVRRGAAGEGVGDDELLEQYARHLQQVGTLLRRRPTFEVLDVEYRAVVVDPVGQARRIAAFLRLRTDPGRMAAAVSSDLYRNRA